MSKQNKSLQDPTHDEISALAHKIYESEGRPEGKAMEHWLQAEAQLVSGPKSQPAKAPANAVGSSSGNRNWSSGNQRQPAGRN